MSQFILAKPTTPRVNSIIEQIQELTPLELVILIQAMAQLLAQTFSPFRSKTLEELQIEQESKIMADISQAKADFWPQDETITEFEQYLATERAGYHGNVTA